MLKVILFDLDGTLLDTAADFTRVLNALLAQHGHPAVSYAQIRMCVSNGARAVVERGFGLPPESPGFAPLLEEFLDGYANSLANQTSLFPGMAEVLQKIEQRGQRWGIVTNKPARFTLPLLAELKLDQRCAVAICPDHVSQRKPHPEPILLACDKLACHIDEAVYVGDHLRDIESGRNAGMTTIACRYGYIADNERIESWGADHIVADTRELDELLSRLSA